MSENVNILQLSAVLVLLTLFPFVSAAQDNVAADTAGYVPSWYAGALDYNLMIAASRDLPGEIDRLIRAGADVNSYNEDGSTPLIIAVDYNSPEAVRAILKHSPTLDDFTVNSETALLIAVKKNSTGIAETLIRAGATVNIADSRGATPLHYASLYGYDEMAAMLLYYSAQPDTKAGDGTAALHAAVCAGNVETADILINGGANMEIRDGDGNTPFLIAASFGDTVIMDILRSYGVDIYSKNSLNHNALALAIAFGHSESVRYLLGIGDRWNENSPSGNTPLQVAARYGRRDIAAILREANIHGTVKPSFNQASLSMYARFTRHNFYSGFGLSLREPYLNAGITAGFNAKLWETRLLVEQLPGSYYQYIDKSAIAFAGLFKDFTVAGLPGRQLVVSTTLLAGYTFGNKFKGTEISPERKLTAIPGITVKWVARHVALFAGTEWHNLGYCKTGSVWATAGLSYSFYFDSMPVKQKRIKWN
ncbi:MAG: ankyrin repeat domain-containing protein [Bacteroidales bacterium]|nr:ankyrin repeat domain-containing protein [Bacteroidales bacterium]